MVRLSVGLEAHDGAPATHVVIIDTLQESYGLERRSGNSVSSAVPCS